MEESLILLMVLSLFMGCACWLLFLWGVQKGEFQDMERPKQRMLDDPEDEGDQATPSPPPPVGEIMNRPGRSSPPRRGGIRG